MTMRLLGVVHLPALPGSPRSALSLAAIIAAGVRDALALADGGVDGVIIENYHDVPFRAGPVDAHTVAAMTVAACAIRSAIEVPIGINVLRNDAGAALGIAVASGATFIRVNVHTGAMLTDQGIITGRADETLRLRRQLGAEQIAIFADVLVKHAVTLGPVTLENATRDAVERGLADAVIVTGSATGEATLAEDVQRVAAVAGVPVYVGSGVSATNISEVVPPATGVIVGTWLKRDGMVANPVDVERVRQLRAAFDVALSRP